MFSEEYESYLNNEFNRLNPGLADLEKAERKSRDASEFDSGTAFDADDYICHVCYMPLGISDPEDTHLCAEHYSDWLERKAEEERGLRVTSIGDSYWIDYVHSRRPSYAVDAEEANAVQKQIDKIYERLQAQHFTPEQEYDSLVHFAEQGDAEAMIKLLNRDPSNHALVVFIKRHMVAAMKKGFMLSGASVERLKQYYLNLRYYQTEPFWSRKCLWQVNGVWENEYIPF